MKVFVDACGSNDEVKKDKFFEKLQHCRFFLTIFTIRKNCKIYFKKYF